MGYREQVFYGVVCDYPECGATDDGGEYAFWSDKGYARDAALDAEWDMEEDGERLFCNAHAEHIIWRSDEEPPTDVDGVDDARILTLPDGERVVLS